MHDKFSCPRMLMLVAIIAASVVATQDTYNNVINFVKPHALSSPKSSLTTSSDTLRRHGGNGLRKSTPELSPYKWFQEIYYLNNNCAGVPYRTYDYVLGKCFKDSPSTSFLMNLEVDGDIISYYEYADTTCTTLKNTSSSQFTGSKYEDTDTLDPNAQCEVVDQGGKNRVPFSLQTVYFETEYNPEYPASGQVSKMHDMSASCNPMQIVSSNWHNENACIPKGNAQIGDGDQGLSNAKYVKFVCNNNGSHPDTYGYFDEKCQQPVTAYIIPTGRFLPQCSPGYAPFTDFTPPPPPPSSPPVLYINSFQQISCLMVSTTAPTKQPVTTALPSLLPTAPPSTTLPSASPEVSTGSPTGSDESSGDSSGNTSGGNSGDKSGSGDSNVDSQFLMDSLSTELLIIIIVSSIAFCLCITILICFLCMRLQSQDSLNRDLMQSFVQLVERNGRALRNMQEKFSNRMRRSQHVSKARETEMRERETRGLLSASRSDRDGSGNGKPKRPDSEGTKGHRGESSTSRSHKSRARVRDDDDNDDDDDEEDDEYNEDEDDIF